MTQKQRVAFLVLGVMCAWGVYVCGRFAWHYCSWGAVLFIGGITMCTLEAFITVAFFWMATCTDTAPAQTP